MKLLPPRVLLTWVALGNVVVIALMLLMAWLDSNPPWKSYQLAYISSEKTSAKTDAQKKYAENLTIGIREIKLATGRSVQL